MACNTGAVLYYICLTLNPKPMENQEKINSLLMEHAVWQQRLAAYKMDLKKFYDDLGSYLLRKEPRDIPSDAEHFQNQFILQREVLDILRHDMKQYENLLESNFEKPGKNTISELESRRDSLASRLDDFVKIFNELCREYGAFKSEGMVAL